VSSPLPSREFRDELDEAGREWVRVRIWLERGQVVRFTVQYETTGPNLADDPLPVVRYDTAHGLPHRDRLDRRGREIGKDFLSSALELWEALNYAERDVRQNWPRYRQEFFGD
jgi:hypothetical protein